jgi:hypothetical protein
MLPMGRFCIDEDKDEEVWNRDGPAIVPQLSSRAIQSSSSPFTKPKGAPKVKSSNEYKEEEEEEEEEEEGMYDDTGDLYEFVSDEEVAMDTSE